MGDAERPWYSFLFSWETKLEQLDKPEYGRIGRTFISEDRRRARFILRMKEGARSRPRATVINEIRAIARAQGFRVRAVSAFRLSTDATTWRSGVHRSRADGPRGPRPAPRGSRARPSPPGNHRVPGATSRVRALKDSSTARRSSSVDYGSRESCSRSLPRALSAGTSRCTRSPENTSPV
jgi:hypothetical protein